MARWLLVGAVFAAGCGSSLSRPVTDGGVERPAVVDAGRLDAVAVCLSDDAGAIDGSDFTDPTCGCPRGNVCVMEVGGVAGGGGSHCTPLPPQCHGVPTCDCMALCACTSPIGLHPERCTEQSGSLLCDNGIR